MCASIETYANDRAMDAAIIACIDFNKTAEEAVSYVGKKFPEVDNDKIIERVKFLWVQTKRE